VVVLIYFVGIALGQVPSLPLHNAAVSGLTMPAIGIGTGGYGGPGNVNGEWWDNNVAFDAVKTWLEYGGKRIDTSMSYDTEVGIGAAIISSGVDRKDLFITSKTGPYYPLGYDETLIQAYDAIRELQTPYVDLLLIHWPGPDNSSQASSWPCYQGQKDFKKCRQESWLALERVFNEGKALAIGVSNFEQNHLEDILELNSLIPAVNQVEYHPYWHEDGLVKFCKEHNIVFNSYSSVGCPDHMKSPDNPQAWKTQVIEQPIIQQIAQKYNRTAAQIVLQWSWQQGLVVNARSLTPAHLKENLEFFGIQLTESEIQQIGSVPAPPNPKVCGDPRIIP